MKALGSIAGAKRCGPGPFGPLEITCLYFMNLLDKQEARKITILGISKVTGSLVINNVHMTSTSYLMLSVYGCGMCICNTFFK